MYFKGGPIHINFTLRFSVGIKEEAAFNVAVVELGGHLPIKSKLSLIKFI